MDFYRNYAIGDTRRRVGKNRFTNESFYDLAERLKGQHQIFATFLSYGEEFLAHAEQEEKGPDGKIIKYAWSAKGWSGEAPATFTDFPVDFDASDNLDVAFEQCRSFVQKELLDKGIDTRYFVIYLSGGKGFHVHISSSVLNVELPVENAGFRLKTLAAAWKQTYSSIDLSIYTGTSLFRLPGTQHKSLLYKVEIAWEDFNLEHLARRGQWANSAPAKVRIPELSQPPVLIELPEYVHTVTQLMYTAEVDFDENARITPNCRWLQTILQDPTANGNDGSGREKRRNAIGILLSAHETSEHNPELQQFVAKLEEHEYMTPDRMSDVAKWIREYDRDGEIKCKKTCYSVGCPAVQRKICGTRSPLDWKLKKRQLELTPIDEAREYVSQKIDEVLDEEGNGVYVVDFPVGIGKTYNMIKKVRERGLTAFYVAQTHKLALQTHINFINQGIESRHIASRAYLTDEIGFDCVFPLEVEMAIGNGYGSHTICSTCPRKRKKQSEDAETLEADEGYEPCDYWEQFEGLKDIDVVVGVHNHLFEFMYDSAGVAARSVTIIDESPIEALGQTINPLDETKLGRIRGAIDDEIAFLDEATSQPPKPAANTGLFARVANVMEADLARALTSEQRRQLEHLRAFRHIFHGEMFDLELFAHLSYDQIRGIWYEAASRIADVSGLSLEYSLPDDMHYLCIPFPIPAALQLAGRNVVYNPEVTSYLPVRLPPNKVVILDATANNDAYARIVANLTRGIEPRYFRFIPHPLVEQPYSHVTQITSSSYGVSSLYHEETRDYLYAVISALMKKHPGKSLIVCHKQHEWFWKNQFSKNREVHIATYGSLKGLNHWEDCVAQYIVGTPFIPDVGVRDLAAKLGEEVDTYSLEQAAGLKRILMLAKNGDTAVVSRRVYKGFPFHSAIAQMKSQWEVTQAVRLRLYNKTSEDKQNLYIFSNVDLKGMYADEYCTLSELAFELSKAEKAEGRKELEVKGVAYEQITAWFEELPAGTVFVKNNIPEFSGDRYIQYWLQAAIDAGWVEKLGKQRKYVKCG